MTEDAKLSIGAEDNLTPVLAKMAAQTRAFGRTIDAESSKIEKAVKGVTKSINDLNTSSGGRGKTSALAAQTAKLTAELREQEAVMQRLNRASSVTPTASGRLRGADGRLVSQADVKAYNDAKAAADSYSTRLEELNRNLAVNAQREQQAATATSARAKALANLPGPSLSRQSELEDMRAYMMANSGSTIKTSESWFPPAMLQGPRRMSEAVAELAPTVRYAMYDVSRSAAIAGTAFLAASVGAVVAAANWERAFADVERTVGGTPAQLETVRQSLISLSQQLPITFTELSEIASVGGQMGMSAQGVVAYTEVIAKLTATTNLTADAASKALGRFKAFFSEADDPTLAVTDQTFSNLASSILKVGVNSVATESGIVNVGVQIASMGDYAGFTADQVVGLAGALSSVGVPPELSRGVITRLFTMMGESVSEGGTKLADFAAIAGTSSAEFASAWGTDRFAYVFTDFIEGLGSMEARGQDATAALHELGVTSVRDVPVLLRLASAAGAGAEGMLLLAQTMNDARSGWRRNLELSLQYSKINETLAARSQVLLQSLEALFATMGESAVGPVKTLVEMTTNLVKGFTAMANTDFGQFMSGSAIAVGALVAGMALLVSGSARGIAALQGIHQGLEAITGRADVATRGVKVLGIAMGTLGVVAAVVAVVGTIAAIATAANEAYKPVTDLNGALEAMQADTANGSSFTEFAVGADYAAQSAESASDQAGRMIDIMGGLEDQSYGAADAVEAVGGAAKEASLNFGVASREFLKSSIMNSEAFTNLTKTDVLAGALRDTRFSMNQLIQIVAEGGREAGSKYLEGITGLVPNTDAFDAWNKSLRESSQGVKMYSGAELDLMHQTGELLSVVESGVNQFDAAARGYSLASEGAKQYASSLQLTEDELTAFALTNEDAVNSMAEGFSKFVDTGSLIGLTQQLQAAYAVVDDGSTEVNESAEALAGFEKAWEDAYGGASFSIASYMDVFRRAATEQETFIGDLQELMARGVDPAIIGDLAAMGPQAAALVEALVNSTEAELQEYEDLYGRTGFNAMVSMAAGQLAAETIVRNAAKSLSTTQLQELSASLAAGTPLTDAMAKWNLDAQGKPMTAPANAVLNPNWHWMFQNIMNQNPVSVGVVPRLTQSRIFVESGGSTGGISATRMYLAYSGGYIPGYAGGGYTGAGGKYQPKGVVHGGEYVFPKKDVNQSTGRPTEAALIRMLSGARISRGGGSYANGGYATSSSDSMMVELSPRDRALLERLETYVSIGDDVVARSVGRSNGSSRRQGRG